jgi:hypothetical protein
MESTYLLSFFNPFLTFLLNEFYVFPMPQPNNLSSNIPMFYNPLFCTYIRITFLVFQFLRSKEASEYY